MHTQGYITTHQIPRVEMELVDIPMVERGGTRRKGRGRASLHQPIDTSPRFSRRPEISSQAVELVSFDVLLLEDGGMFEQRR